MKQGLFFRREDGAEIPISEVKGVTGKGIIILKAAIYFTEEDRKSAEERYSKAFGDNYKVVLIGREIEEVMRAEI